MANEPKKVRQRRSMLQIPGVQTILSSLLCIVLGLLVGFVVLLLIDHGVSEKTGNLNAVDAILVIIKNFWKYGSSTAQMKYLGNTLVKTAPLLMCALAILFAYKVGLFNIGAAGQYCAGVALSLYAALGLGWSWLPCMLLAICGGAILGGMYAGRLCTTVEMTVNVPFDVMFAMASLVHKESAHHIVPTVVEYMEPFFQRTAEVESLVSEEVHKADKKRIEETLEKAKEIAKKMADGSAPIIKTLGDAVVGGSSQAVGSPTNCGRIAHELLNEGEKVTEITIELYPELFARRTINVPGVLMGAVYGCSTSDYKTYEVAVERVKADGVKVNIVRGEEYQIQKVTLVTDKGNSVMVDTLNRGGGRLVLRNATPSLEKAQEAAKKLGIVVVE